MCIFDSGSLLILFYIYWYCFSSSSKKPESRKKHNILESIPVFISYTHLSQSRSAMICSATLRRDVLKTPDYVPTALGSALSDSICCTVCRRWRPSEWKSLSQGHHDSVFFFFFKEVVVTRTKVTFFRHFHVVVYMFIRFCEDASHPARLFKKKKMIHKQLFTL